MSEEERQDDLKVIRGFNENCDSSSRGRGGRWRGNRTAQSPKADKPEAEADITSGGVSYFNAEITGKISDLSTLNDDDTEDAQARLEPTVLFTCSDDPQQKTDKQPDPKVESSPMDSESAVPLFGVCTETYNTILYCLKKCFQFFQSAGFMLLSFISSQMQSAQSATTCSTA
jgi:hypothetical protein